MAPYGIPTRLPHRPTSVSSTCLPSAAHRRVYATFPSCEALRPCVCVYLHAHIYHTRLLAHKQAVPERKSAIWDEVVYIWFNDPAYQIVSLLFSRTRSVLYMIEDDDSLQILQTPIILSNKVSIFYCFFATYDIDDVKQIINSFKA